LCQNCVTYLRSPGTRGTFAIQLAKHLGAIVATTTSTANVDLVRRLGAEIVIDYKKEHFSHFSHLLRDYAAKQTTRFCS
jgi:NADPH:quinone reductase-like Zn-dependent oxidoreductase